MKLERRTRLYILIGVIFLTSVVAIQYIDIAVRHAEIATDKAVRHTEIAVDKAVWNVKETRNETKDLLYGTYPPNNNPDLELRRGNGPTSSPIGSFAYRTHYIREMPSSWGDEELVTGIFLLRLGTENFLEKRYNKIPVNSSLRIDAFNEVILSPEVNKSYHCQSVNMTITQDERFIGYRDVSSTEDVESFVVDINPSENVSSIRIEITPSKECGDKSQILGVDKFFLVEPEGTLPAGVVNKVIYLSKKAIHDEANPTFPSVLRQNVH